MDLKEIGRITKIVEQIENDISVLRSSSINRILLYCGDMSKPLDVDIEFNPDVALGYAVFLENKKSKYENELKTLISE